MIEFKNFVLCTIDNDITDDFYLTSEIYILRYYMVKEYFKVVREMGI